MSVIDDYLAQTTPENRAVLQHIRELTHEQIGNLEEVMSYGMPGFRYTPKGKIVLGFAVNKHSMSIYPHSGQTLDHMSSDITPYRSALSALQFTPEKQLPDELVREFLQVRLQEILDGYGGKKSSK